MAHGLGFFYSKRRGSLSGLQEGVLMKVPSNHRFERSRVGVFGEPRRESMIGVNQFRLSLAQPRDAQPDRYAPR